MNKSFGNLVTFSGHSGAVYSIDFDGEFIYSGSADKYVVRWNVEDGTQDSFAIKFPFTPYMVKLFNDNSLLAVGLASGDLHIFDLSERKEIKFFQQHRTGIFAIEENQFTHHLYVADADGTVSVWNVKTLDLVIYLPLDAGKIRAIETSADGKLFYVLAQDGNVRVFDAQTFNEIELFHAHQDGATACMELTNDLLLTGGKDAHIKVWDRFTYKVQQSIPAHNYVIYDLLKLNDEVFVSASRDKTIKVWNSQALKVIQRIERKDQGHKHSVNQLVKISENSFASCSDDGTIKVWKLK